MFLGTSEPGPSLALAILPPGNVLRELSLLRAGIFRSRGEPSARAYFCFPVLAWLAAVPGGQTLAGLAASMRAALEFGPWLSRGRDLFLGFSPALSEACARHSLETAAGGSGSCPGPFEAGLGLYCASVDSADESAAAALASDLNRSAPTPPRADTWLLAAVELSWSPGPGRESSWAVLSSARSGIRGRFPARSP